MGVTVDHGRRPLEPHPLPLGKEINMPGPQEPTINLSQDRGGLDPLGDTDEPPHRIQLRTRVVCNCRRNPAKVSRSVASTSGR